MKFRLYWIFIFLIISSLILSTILNIGKYPTSIKADEDNNTLSTYQNNDPNHMIKTLINQPMPSEIFKHISMPRGNFNIGPQVIRSQAVTINLELLNSSKIILGIRAAWAVMT